MFHKSELEDYAEHFPQDQAGYVPTDGDSWRQMKFDHAGQDPEEEGISQEERASRLEYLDKEWWPKVLEQVQQKQGYLAEQHGKTFIERWERLVNKTPREPRGFEVE